VRRSPRLEPVREIIDGWLRVDLDAPRKQRHGIKPILAAPATEEEAAVGELSGIGRYERRGQGPPVVILSNPQADPAWWAQPFTSALAGAGYEAITFVHAGPSWAPAGVAGDVATFIEHATAEPVRLLGWSQGAAIAQETALLRPDLVASAALIATYGRQNIMDRILQGAWRALDAAGPELDPARAALLLLTSYPPQQLGDDSRAAKLAAGAARQAAGRAGDAEPRQRAAAFIAAYQDRLRALTTVTVPCLVMGFADDADTFAARAREVAGAIPASEYIELPGTGHLTPVTDPAAVIGPVLEFFRRTNPRN
jgi:pimeloyl-ACP methyl ester carboxylesterase